MSRMAAAADRIGLVARVPGIVSDTGARPESQWPTPPSNRFASVDLERGVLDLRVLLHGVDRHVLAVAGLLVAAVRHLGGSGQQVAVPPDRAERWPPHRVKV